jgi:hypothetical protein
MIDWLKPGMVRSILDSIGITDEIVSVGAPNRWIMESRKIYMADGKVLLLKIGINDEWTDNANIQNQVSVSRMLRETGILQPALLVYADNDTEYGFRFLLSEAHTGVRLYDLYRETDSDKRIRLFQSLAVTYSRIHSRKNAWSGIWNGSPDKRKYPLHPAQFFNMAEINGGSGQALYQKGLIDKECYDAICTAWDSNLPYLEQREASLVHVSPFPWSIYLSPDTVNVTGLAALGDFMWWDAMSDVAHLLYPPFLDITDAEREAFLKYYSEPVDFEAISLYRLLNKICAVSGVYMAPNYIHNQSGWVNSEIPKIAKLVDDIRFT